MEEQYDDEEMRRIEWARTRERMQIEKRRQMRWRKILKIVAPVAAVCLVALMVMGISSIVRRPKGEKEQDSVMTAAGNVMTAAGNAVAAAGNAVAVAGDAQAGQEGDSGGAGTDGAGSGEASQEHPLGKYKITEKTQRPGGDIVSSYVIFIDIDTGNILMRRNEASRMNPASMTKVLTLLVAVEHIDNLDDTFTITSDITDYCFVHDCSTAGFEKGDTVTVRDLLYGTILPSGADAALGLAAYVAGSEEAFVEMMNEKLDELGLSGTAHFTNCVGLYDENHYCTVYDMAVIMENAVCDETCREVLSAHTYQTSPTQREPEGLLISNWFLRRIEDKDTGGEVLCGKTGYVNQSGNCAVSYGVDKQGKKYICVTAKCEQGGWKCIGDHVRMYKQFSGTT